MLEYIAVRNSFKLWNIGRVIIIAEVNRTINPNNSSVDHEELRTLNTTMFILFYCYTFRSFWKVILRLCEQDI